MNKVILMGRLTKEPLLRTTQNSKSVCNFTLAIDRYPEGVDFINCIAWEKSAIAIQDYVRKGHKLLVEGRMQTGSYDDKDGKRVYTTDVVVERFEFIESKKTEEIDNEVIEEETTLNITADDLPF